MIDKRFAVAVTGHRTVGIDIEKDQLKRELYNLIEKGYNTFLIGMAVGFDTICFNVLLDIKKIKDIKIVACVPCKEQDKYFNFFQKKEYSELLNSADETIILSENYTNDCMKKRNMFMVDNASVLVAYLRQNRGGTAFTVNYAKTKNIDVIFV